MLKEISPGCSLEGLMLKLKLQYFGHLLRRVDSFEKTLMFGGTWGRRRRGWQRIRWLDGITDLMGTNLSKLLGVGGEQGGLACCDSWAHKTLDTTERLNWTELNWRQYGLLNLSVFSMDREKCITNPCNYSLQFSSVTKLCTTLCNPMDCSTPGFPVLHQLLEITQTHVHRVGDAIQPSHPVSSPSPPALNLSQHQGLF